MSEIWPNIDHMRDYPYFWASFLAVLWMSILGRIVLNREAFRLSVIAGLLNAPSFFFLVHFEGAYWTPARPTGWPVDYSDVLCSYYVATMAWFALNVFQPKQLVSDFSWRVFLVRYNLAALISIVLFLASHALGLDPMSALLVTCLCVTVWLWRSLTRLRWLALEGGFRFALLYLAYVKVVFWLWPDFASQWNSASAWGRQWAGIPLGEIAWAPVFGFYWTLFMAYVMGIQIQEANGAQPARPGDLDQQANA